VLAETPEEIRGLRRGIATGFATVLALSIFLIPVLSKVPEERP